MPVELGDELQQEKDAQEFNDALIACKFGKFNILLLCAAFAGCTAMLFSSTSIAYIMPSAACDLKLTLEEKGYLNAITYIGMIISCLIWAIISDTRGRRNVVISAYLLDAIFVMCCACSQSILLLLIFKFWGGFAIGGGYSALMTYIAEVHRQDLRFRIFLITGIMLTTTTVTLPGLATLILPHDWDINIFNFTFHSWHLFLAVSALPSAICGIAFIWFPETPKFHLSQNNTAEAQKIFQKIFAWNTGRPAEEFPMKELTKRDVAIVAMSNNPLSIIKDAWQQIKPFFKKKYIWIALGLFLAEFCVLMSQNTIRLWLPDLFAHFEEYDNLQDAGLLDTPNNRTRSSLCVIFQYDRDKSDIIDNETATCHFSITSSSYLNNFIVGIFALISFVAAYYLVRVIGAKKILTISLAISTFCSYLWYFTISRIDAVIVVSLCLAMENIATTALMNCAVSYFPTQIRNTVMAIAFLCGRIGTVLGNIILPVFIRASCFATTFAIGTVVLVACLVSLFLPNPKKMAFV